MPHASDGRLQVPSNLDDQVVLAQLRAVTDEVIKLRRQVMLVHATVIVGNLGAAVRSLRGIADDDRATYMFYWGVVIVASIGALVLARTCASAFASASIARTGSHTRSISTTNGTSPRSARHRGQPSRTTPERETSEPDRLHEALRHGSAWEICADAGARRPRPLKVRMSSRWFTRARSGGSPMALCSGADSG